MWLTAAGAEALPLVYLEALASGLAVCGPEAGGVPDTFTAGEHGTLSWPLDTVSAVEALEEAMALSGKRAQLLPTPPQIHNMLCVPLDVS